MRRPRTQQERAANEQHDGEGIKIRAKRSPRNIPTSYTDLPRGDHDHRTWKRHRHKQYK